MKLRIREEFTPFDKDGSLYEQANLKPKTTGQKFDFWVDEAGCDRNVQHNEPRFKPKANGVQLDVILHNDDTIEIVNGAREIRDFKYSKEAVDFVDRFKIPLRMHWNHEIETAELASIIRMVFKKDVDVLDAISRVVAGDY